MTILELREKRNKAWEAAKAFVETKRDKDGLLSAEDAASYAEMEQKIKDYGAEIERIEQMESIENSLNKPVSTPLTGKPMNGADKPKTGSQQLGLKKNLLVCSINRQGKIITPTGQDTIQEGDIVVVVTTHKGIRDLGDIVRY